MEGLRDTCALDGLFILGFAACEHLLEGNGLVGPKSGMLDGGPDEMPPFLEPRLGGPPGFELRVAKQHGIKRMQDFAAMVLRPSNRVLVLEDAVFGIDAVCRDPRFEGTRCLV